MGQVDTTMAATLDVTLSIPPMRWRASWTYPLVRQVHARVESVKKDRRMEVEYMTLLERDQRNIERGKTEGKAEERIAAARNFKLLGVSDEVIAKATGLSEEVVRELLNS